MQNQLNWGVAFPIFQEHVHEIKTVVQQRLLRIRSADSEKILSASENFTSRGNTNYAICYKWHTRMQVHVC